MREIHAVVVHLPALSEALEGGFCLLDNLGHGSLLELSVGPEVLPAAGAHDPALLGWVIIGDRLAATKRAFGRDGDIEFCHPDGLPHDSASG